MRDSDIVISIIAANIARKGRTPGNTHMYAACSPSVAQAECEEMTRNSSFVVQEASADCIEASS